MIIYFLYAILHYNLLKGEVKMKKLKLLWRIVLSLLTASFIVPLGATADSAAKDENIVKGLTYTVETGIDISASFALFGNETDPALGRLTDGKRSFSSDLNNPIWHVFYRGLYRTVTFELPEVKAVTGFRFHGLKHNTSGLIPSDYYDLFVSENGTDWMLACSYDNSDNVGGTDRGQFTIAAENVGRFRAKYVRLKFRVDGYTYCDEIEILGTDINGTEEKFVKYIDPYNYKNAYHPGIERCKDLILLYCGYKGELDRSYVENTEEEMLYYCGYISPKGEIIDTMFDSFMFSALRNTLPSGRNCGKGGDPPLMSDWQYYIDSIFDEEFNCGAIERALDKVKAATGKTDHTMQLVINMPYPNIGQKAIFGDIDGDGKDEYCTNREEQLKIYAWFMDAVIQKMNERNYKNIRLAGFYWEPESIKPIWGKEEYELIKSVSELVHERDLNFFWIPLLYASGMDRVEEMGFDVAMMQPDIPWTGYERMKLEMFYGFTEAIKKYGLGVEIEMSWGVYNITSDDADLRLRQFYAYLDAGYALGFMKEAVHGYYQDANPGIIYYLAKSQNSRQRQTYDDIYAFIKGTYKPHINITAKEFSGLSGEKIYGYVGIRKGEYADIRHGDIYLEVVTPPSHGKIELSPKSGDFTYISENNFEGTDTFTVVARSEFVLTEPLEVKVNVTKKSENSIPREEESPDEECLPENSPDESKPDKKGGFGTALAIGTGVAAGVVATTVVAVKKKRNKK